MKAKPKQLSADQALARRYANLHTPAPDRRPYQSPQGIAEWWSKDGAWHIALPHPDPDPETGLRTGGFRWTATAYRNRQEAIDAITTACEDCHTPGAPRRAYGGHVCEACWNDRADVARRAERQAGWDMDP